MLSLAPLWVSLLLGATAAPGQGGVGGEPPCGEGSYDELEDLARDDEGFAPAPAPASTPAAAAGRAGDDEGFAPAPVPDPTLAAAAISSRAATARRLRIGLRLSADWAARAQQLSDRPLAQARQTVGAELAFRRRWLRARAEARAELDAAYWLGTEPDDEATLRTYRARVLHGEQYLAAALGPVELTAGRQIVPWGEGLVLGVLRGVEARDLRVPGQAALGDLRLGVLASRAALFVGRQRLEIVATHEGRYDERPPPLGELSPLRTPLTEDPLAATLLGGKDTVVWRDEPAGFGWETQGVLARWLLHGSMADVGLYAAWAPDPGGAASLPPVNELLRADPLEIPMDHPRRWQLGTSGAAVVSAWVLRWEAVVQPDQPTTVGDLGARPTTLHTERGIALAGLLGCTWTGLADTAVSLEATHLELLDAPVDVLLPVAGPALALRAQRQFLRQRLSVEIVTVAIGAWAEHGGLGRLSARYELLDGLHAQLGVLVYRPGTSDAPGPLTGLNEHDRLFAGLRWDLELL